MAKIYSWWLEFINDFANEHQTFTHPGLIQVNTFNRRFGDEVNVTAAKAMSVAHSFDFDMAARALLNRHYFNLYNKQTYGNYKDYNAMKDIVEWNFEEGSESKNYRDVIDSCAKAIIIAKARIFADCYNQQNGE